MRKLEELLKDEKLIDAVSELSGRYIFCRPEVFSVARDMYQRGNMYKTEIVRRIGECEVDELLRREVIEKADDKLYHLTGLGELQVEICLNLLSAFKKGTLPPDMSKDEKKELMVYARNIIG